jgi:hypothetical protein
MPISNTAERPGLNVSIVGAGLAGLAAAVALRRAGHQVQVGPRELDYRVHHAYVPKIFDSVHDIGEIGAAIVVPRNGARVLEHFGYDDQNLNGVKSEGVRCFVSVSLQAILIVKSSTLQQIIFDAISGERRNTTAAKGTPVRFLNFRVRSAPEPAQTIMCHRSDLHSELKRLALGPGDGLPAVLHLSTKVVDCDTDAGLLELADGRRVQSDLVLGADGIAVSGDTYNARRNLNMNSALSVDHAHSYPPARAEVLWHRVVLLPRSAGNVPIRGKARDGVATQWFLRCQQTRWPFSLYVSLQRRCAP